MNKFKMAVLMASLGVGVFAKADPPATHGMILFGDKANYVSHLPMFHSPHDYQLVMKIGLESGPRSTALAAYAKEKSSGQKLFTVVPDPFDIALVMNGSLNKLAADLYSGHFEKGGKKLGAVVLKVEKILLAKKLDPATLESNLDYLVFGIDGEYFGVHSIKGKPSFDTVVKVNAPYEVFQSHCRTRLCDEPKLIPVKDSVLPVTISQSLFEEAAPLPAKNQSIGDFTGLQSEIMDVIYLEQNELSH